jgi:HEAT repeat protein
LLGLCSSPNDNVRLAALYHVGIMGRASSESILLDALGDADWVIRENAIYGLGKIRSRAAVPQLTELLRSPRRWERLEARRALAKISRTDEERLAA